MGCFGGRKYGYYYSSVTLVVTAVTAVTLSVADLYRYMLFFVTDELRFTGYLLHTLTTFECLLVEAGKNYFLLRESTTHNVIVAVGCRCLSVGKNSQ